MATIEIPKKIEIPRIKPGATASIKPYPAKEKHMEYLGFPLTRVSDYKRQAILKMKELLKKYKSLRLFMDICVRCGSCSDKCQFFLGTGDPKNMPVARAELFRKIYRRYFTPFGRLTEADLTDDILNDWFVYFHQCSQCRRCSVFCPYGIDTAEISMAAREVMDSIGMGQKYTTEVLVKLLEIGNNLGLQKPALQNTLTFIEEEIKEESGVDVRLPLDLQGSDVLFITPSADFFASPHIESLKGYAKVFHKAGISWTISSYASEAGNFSMFIGNYSIMQKAVGRIKDAIESLKPKRLIVGECGHAWRVAYNFWNTICGPFNLEQPFPMHICEFTYKLIKDNVISLDRSFNDKFVVTFHDSCNVARASSMGDFIGGQFEIPRALIKLSCNKYVEMDPETIKEKTFCCGAGGGLLTDELMDIRIKGALPRMSALKDVIDLIGLLRSLV